MNQQQKALQMQRQFVLHMQEQYKELQQYAAAHKQEQLLAKAVMWTLKDTAADNIGMPEDEQYNLARISVAATTLNFIQQGLTPEQVWGALVGV